MDATKPADTWFPRMTQDEWERRVVDADEYEGVKYEIVEYTAKQRGDVE